MEIQFSAATDVGRKRKHNEDNYLTAPEIGLFIVCDGMGGHAAGEVASRLAVETVKETIAEHYERVKGLVARGEDHRREVLAVVESAVQLANARVHGEATENDERRGMGTTLTMMWVIENRGFIGHVGDSRLYLLRGDQLHQVTTDHTVVNKMIRAGRLKPEDAHKVKYTNALTRAVGVYPSVEVETLDIDVLPGDLFLLCSDGLHGYFSKLDVGQFMSHLDLGSGADELITFANRSGGKDNITALLLKAPGGDTRETLRIRLTISTLREIPLFHYLSFSELLRVITVCKTREYKGGEVVIEEGGRGDELYILVEGEVKVLKGPAEVATLKEGAHFGEMALIDNHPRSATVKATAPSTIIRIERDDFYGMLRDDPVLAVKLLWNFIQTLSMMVRKGTEESVDKNAVSHPYGGSGA